jgi:energy-coupling factor transporter transmembrane protein EcfT
LASFILFFSSNARESIYFKVIYIFIPLMVAIFLLGIWEAGGLNDLFDLHLVILKWIIIALISITYFVVTKPFEIVEAFNKFKFPASASFALGIGLRFIPIIFEEWQKIVTAQKVSCCDKISLYSAYNNHY